ncbi:unnamed protein product [Prunus armeniaca]
MSRYVPERAMSRTWYDPSQLAPRVPAVLSLVPSSIFQRTKYGLEVAITDMLVIVSNCSLLICGEMKGSSESMFFQHIQAEVFDSVRRDADLNGDDRLDSESERVWGLTCGGALGAAGMPKRQTMFFHAKFCTLAAVIVANGSASAHLVK